MNLDWSKLINTINIDGVDGDADEPQSDDVGRGLGATTETNVVLTRTRKMRKESRFSVCLVKKVIKSYNNYE